MKLINSEIPRMDLILKLLSANQKSRESSIGLSYLPALASRNRHIDNAPKIEGFIFILYFGGVNFTNEI